MACSPNKMPQFYWIFVSLILFVNACLGFYFPEEMRNTFSVGDEIYAKVNSLTSTTTELPLSYYSLPYCEPQGGVKKSAMNIVFTYARLSVEDWRWWWKAFFTCGSIGVYMLVDSVKDVVFELIGPVSVVVYMGYSLVMAVAVMLATGTFGFLVSFCFVRYLYSAVSAKISC